MTIHLALMLTACMQVATTMSRLSYCSIWSFCQRFWEMVRATHLQCPRLQGHIGRFVVNQPMVIGHESAGTVVEVGEGVQHLQVPTFLLPTREHGIRY